jgi:hypothetical protein
MPIHKRTDSFGSYYQFGDHGKKYYFERGNKQSEQQAYNKAKRQGAAIHARQSQY